MTFIVGKSVSQASTASTCSPRAATSLVVAVRAEATEICWPIITRMSIS